MERENNKKFFSVVRNPCYPSSYGAGGLDLSSIKRAYCHRHA